MSSRMFTLQKKGTGARIYRLGQGAMESNVISCARSCLQRQQDCMSVMYNSTTSLCTPGSVIDKSGTPPTKEEGTLYARRCDVNKGFRLLRHDDTQVCLKHITDSLKYTEADAACRGMDAFLVSVKTMAKLNIIGQQLFGGNHPNAPFWVGCDDLDQHGLYVWKEDGETFTRETKPVTLDPSQPNGGTEHCLAMNEFALHDYECDLKFHHVCEQSLSWIE